MLWADERYVRVYVRDTPAWLANPWDVRCLFWELLRHVDRAGLLPLGSAHVAALAGQLRAPLDVTERALAAWVKDGCVAILPGDILFVRNYLEAQEASGSDKARKQAERERKAARARAQTLGIVTNCDEESQNVTNCHDLYRAVTQTPGGSPAYMPPESLRAVPCCAVPPEEAMSAVADEPTEKGPTPADLVALWNAKARQPMPRVREMGDRAPRAKARLLEHPDLAWWESVIAAGNASPLCRGEVKPASGASKPWRLNFDFLIANRGNAVRVLEGNYGDDREREAAPAFVPLANRKFEPLR